MTDILIRASVHLNGVPRVRVSTIEGGSYLAIEGDDYPSVVFYFPDAETLRGTVQEVVRAAASLFDGDVFTLLGIDG